MTILKRLPGYEERGLYYDLVNRRVICLQGHNLHEYSPDEGIEDVIKGIEKRQELRTDYFLKMVGESNNNNGPKFYVQGRVVDEKTYGKKVQDSYHFASED